MGLIEAFFMQEVSITPYLRQGAGEAVYGPPETRSCRLEMGAYLMTTYKDPDGVIEQVEARATMFCVGDKIPINSIVTYDGEEYKVINCEEMRGFGTSHLEVFLQ